MTKHAIQHKKKKKSKTTLITMIRFGSVMCYTSTPHTQTELIQF